MQTGYQAVIDKYYPHDNELTHPNNPQPKCGQLGFGPG